MNRSILVIGATGNIGSALTKQLNTFGKHVKAATRQPERYPTHTNVTPVYFDYGKSETYSAALENVNRVFALVDPADTGNPVYEPFLEQACATGIAHMVIVTTMPILRRDGELHPWVEAEAPLVDSGTPYTILRPNWFMQMFRNEYLLSAIQQKSKLSLPIGDARVSFIDTNDIAAVAAVTLTEEGHRNKIYTLTGGEALGLTEISATLSQASGHTIRYEPISLDTWANKMRIQIDSPIFKVYSNLYQTALQGGFAQVTSAVSDLTGHSPTTFLDFAYRHASLWQ